MIPNDDATSRHYVNALKLTLNHGWAFTFEFCRTDTYNGRTGILECHRKASWAQSQKKRHLVT